MASSDSTEIERRMTRCEAMLAVMLATSGLSADPDDYFMLREMLFRRLPHPFDEEWMFLLDRILRRRVERSERGENVSELRQRLGKFEEEVGQSRGKLAEAMQLLQRLQKSAPQQAVFQRYTDQVDQINNTIPRLEKDLRQALDVVTSGHRVLQTDVHSYLVAQSMGIDLNDLPLPRFIPVRVYLSEASQRDVDRVTKAVTQLSEVFGFTVSDEFPAKSGSWWKKWFVKTKEVATQPEVQQRIEKLERALELKGLAQPQANVDKTEAEAVATLVKAVENSPNVAIQAGSLLLVKTTQNGQNCLQVRTLTQRELIHLEKHQDLLTSPSTVMSQLAGISRSDTVATLEAPAAQQGGQPEPP
jgi:hypothetical protein